MKQDIEEYIRYDNHERLHMTLSDLIPNGNMKSHKDQCSLIPKESNYY